ncbi:MAG: glycosyltransferase family 2 protein [Candidatus Gracilibacteria bacterium]|jgi:glycosyltransferase involved in cell wall biosynthesis|nr:glycosyltransferase family 2 protein [Candidatus Gracilibacteria bacterium]
MKISIITPVFNEEKNIIKFLKACEKIDKKNHENEYILVNDGSSDNTAKEITNYKKKSQLNITLLDFKKNQGRLIARIEGAKAAKHDKLLFIDAKCEPFEDILSKIEEENYEPICGNVIQDEKKAISRFFYLTRKKLYKNHFGHSFKNILINTKNFDNIPKGTTVFYIDKKRFLENQPSNQSKNCSDDTSLLWNIVQTKPILKSSKVKIHYNTRTGFIENAKHIYQRGPKFIDYYFTPSKPHFWLINLLIFFIILSIYSIIKHDLIIELIGLIFVSTSILSIYFSKKIKDFFIVFAYFPIFSIIFFLGLIKGILIKFIPNER